MGRSVFQLLVACLKAWHGGRVEKRAPVAVVITSDERAWLYAAGFCVYDERNERWIENVHGVPLVVRDEPVLRTKSGAELAPGWLASGPRA